MTGILLDSDIVIELLRARNPDISAAFESLLSADVPIYFSSVSVAEIGQGARESEARAIAALFSLLVCLPADCDIASRAGEVLRQYRKSHSIGLGDGLIAATALGHSLQLWTRNRKHYPDPRLLFFEPERSTPP